MAIYEEGSTLTADGAEENLSNNAVDDDSSDLEMCYDSAHQLVGIRWPTVEIPQGATINSATIEFRANTSVTSSGTITISAEDSDDAPAITETASNLSNRTETTASDTWTPGNSTAGVTYDTDDFASVVQEIVDRGSWASGNAMLFLFSNAGVKEFNAKTTQHATEYPVITVDYTEAAAGTNFQVNIGDDWKDVESIQINIGDVWKDVAGAQVNIGDAWKEIF